MNELELIEIIFKPQLQQEKPKQWPQGSTAWAYSVAKWQASPLLEGIEDKRIKEVTAVLLDNQSLYMEQNAPEVAGEILNVVAKVYPNLLANKLFSIQPLLGPAGLVYFKQHKWNGDEVQLVVTSEDIVAKTKKMRAARLEKIDFDDLSKQMIEEIDNEMLTDVRNNCGTISTCESPNADKLWAAITTMSQVVHRKSLCKPNWLVIGNELYLKYQNTFDALKIIYKIHVRSTFPKNNIIMGYKDEHWIGSTYIYCPYIPIGYSPQVLDPDVAFRAGFITRYGKKLTRDGGKAFGRITITE